MTAAAGIWTICAMAIGGVVTRPFRWPEAVWAVAGAFALVVLGLVPTAAAMVAIGRGADVYLFLIGMMLLSETAREHGLFDWIAASAAIHARGSSPRLFALVFAAGIVTTTFLSNDATAVVLTPAVYAAASKAKAEPLPLLFACALIANAASFVLPISNPANIVLYGGSMPPLGRWLGSFALPSAASIVATFLALRWVERHRIAGACLATVERPPLDAGGKAALTGIVVTALLLVGASAFDLQLGWPTAIAGVVTTLAVGALARRSPLTPVRAVSWSVLPLVAGLFVLVEAVTLTGVTARLAALLSNASADPIRGAALAGTALALGSNVVNNLPAGLLASIAVAEAHPARIVTDALLIGVDLGPNLSITGSLATILWLQAIRREGQDVSFLRFLKVGTVTMIPALMAALGTRLMLG